MPKAVKKKNKKIGWSTIFYELKGVVKAKIAQNNSQVSAEGRITVKPGQDSIHEFIAGLDRAKFGFYRFQNFLFIVVIVILILLKPAFWQTSIHSQSLMKSLKPSDKDNFTFKTNEKHRYGLRKTGYLIKTSFCSWAILTWSQIRHNQRW